MIRTSNIGFRALAAMVLLAAVALAARAADVVVLKTGAMYEGTLIRFNNSELEMAVEGGKVLLQRSQVSSIHFETTTEAVKKLLQGQPQPTPLPAPPADDELALGAWHKTDRIEIRVKSVEIRRVDYRDLFRTKQRTSNDMLVVTLEIINPSDSKPLRYRDNDFTGFSSLIVDDRGTGSQPVSFGLGARIEGALKSDDEIGPKKTATHVVVFDRPRAGAAFVTFNQSLAGFGATGKAKWRLTAADMAAKP
ncbi:MAG: hypothetical protein KIT68_06910 [Phycisphaeraceae bacterium]|nr:hypothetical protein [Phycisphaeraceae bacterium]